MPKPKRDQEQEHDDRPGWYRQAETEFDDFFGPKATGEREEELLEQWAKLAPEDRDYYACKLSYLNLRAQYSVLRTMQAVLAELQAVDDEPEPAPSAPPRRASPPKRPAAPAAPTGPITDLSQLPPDVLAEIARRQGAGKGGGEAVAPDEVIEPKANA